MLEDGERESKREKERERVNSAWGGRREKHIYHNQWLKNKIGGGGGGRGGKSSVCIFQSSVKFEYVFLSVCV
jgi:hypothetical protein